MIESSIDIYPAKSTCAKSYWASKLLITSNDQQFNNRMWVDQLPSASMEQSGSTKREEVPMSTVLFYTILTTLWRGSDIAKSAQSAVSSQRWPLRVRQIVRKGTNPAAVGTSLSYIDVGPSARFSVRGLYSILYLTFICFVLHGE